jgi:hypothetical protein
MVEKKFFRIRLVEKCPAKTKIVNGVTLTKQWQVKVGEIGNFAKFPGVEAQVVVKQGNGFAPVESTGGAVGGSGGGSGPSSGSAPTPAQDAEGAQTETDGEDVPPDFSAMTVEQLKNYLIAKGVVQNELRNATKPELIERAEFIWSQNQ